MTIHSSILFTPDLLQIYAEVQPGLRGSPLFHTFLFQAFKHLPCYYFLNTYIELCLYSRHIFILHSITLTGYQQFHLFSSVQVSKTLGKTFQIWISTRINSKRKYPVPWGCIAEVKPSLETSDHWELIKKMKIIQGCKMATKRLDKSQHIPSITESPELQGTHKDNRVSLLALHRVCWSHWCKDTKLVSKIFRFIQSSQNCDATSQSSKKASNEPIKQ